MKKKNYQLADYNWRGSVISSYVYPISLLKFFVGNRDFSVEFQNILQRMKLEWNQISSTQSLRVKEYFKRHSKILIKKSLDDYEN